jgi:hypothetical protein
MEGSKLRIVRKMRPTALYVISQPFFPSPIIDVHVNCLPSDSQSLLHHNPAQQTYQHISLMRHWDAHDLTILCFRFS